VRVTLAARFRGHDGFHVRYVAVVGPAAQLYAATASNVAQENPKSWATAG
jgi:hypothetical protein